MEIFESTVDVARHEVYRGDEPYEPDSVVAVVRDSAGVEIETPSVKYIPPTQPDDPHTYEVTLGTNVTGDRRPKFITWAYTIDDYAITTPPERIDIVRPYISLQDYNSRYPYRTLNMRDFRVVERTVRRVIDAYCRQTFQLREHETRVVPGGSTNTLQLPDRLLHLEGVTVGGGYNSAYSITSTIRFEASSPWSLFTKGSVHLSPRQADPLDRASRFGNQHYYVTGDWGWRHVPQEVRDAAAILINDFLDDDSVYREKYIDNIRAADWRMEFSATGNETTGNANADVMLDRFKNYRPEVV